MGGVRRFQTSGLSTITPIIPHRSLCRKIRFQLNAAQSRPVPGPLPVRCPERTIPELPFWAD